MKLSLARERQLKKQLARLDQLIDAHVAARAELTAKAERLQQVRGVGRVSEVDPESWTGRIVNPNSEPRSQCPRSDVSTVPI